MPFFGSSKKSPQDVARNLYDSLVILENDTSGKKSEKASEDVTKLLLLCKNILVGTGDQEPQADLVAQLAQEFYDNNIFLGLESN